MMTKETDKRLGLWIGATVVLAALLLGGGLYAWTNGSAMEAKLADAERATLVAEKATAETAAERDALVRRVADYEAILGWRELLARVQATESIVLNAHKLDRYGSAPAAVAAINEAARVERERTAQAARAAKDATKDELEGEAASGAPGASGGKKKAK